MNPKKRVDRIFGEIDRDSRLIRKPDAILLANAAYPYVDLSFFYVTGYLDGLFERTFLLARRDGRIAVFTTPLEAGNARRKGTEEIEVYSENDDEAMRERIKKVASDVTKSVGVNSGELTLEMFNSIKSIFQEVDFVDVKEPIRRARAVKDTDEINHIKKACDISSRVYRKIPEMLHEGLTESELAAEVAFEMQHSGGSGLAFGSIVGFGRNSAKQHYTPTNYKLRRNQLVILDYGTTFKRYCSDITRTLVFGKVSKEQRRIYNIVHEAYRVGVENCLAENNGKDVHARVASVINSTEYRGKFIHSTGHSLGLSVHEGGFLSNTSDIRLEPGMVVTVEPGIYLPELGGVRIEDTVLVTNSKPKVLTSASRELIECGPRK